MRGGALFRLAILALTAPHVSGACPGGQYKPTGGVCTAQPKCQGGEFLQGSDAETKGVCKTCSFATCPSTGQYRAGACAGTTNGYKCTDQPKCKGGEFLKGSSPKTKGDCTKCSFATCPSAGQYRAGDCTGTTNGYTCAAQPKCKGGEFLKGSSPVSRGACTACSNTQCPTGTYRQGTCATTVDGFTCAGCGNIDCPVGKYRRGTFQPHTRVALSA